MNEMTLFVQTGKNKHDDACDSLAMLVESLDARGKVVMVMKGIFYWKLFDCRKNGDIVETYYTI